MSEIKPVGFVSETAMKQISSGGYEGVNLRTKEGSAQFQEAWGRDIPLYTARQLAEAVAAERERCLAAVEGVRIPADGWGDPIDDGDCERNEGIDLALEAIRSASK